MTFPDLQARWYPTVAVAWGIALNEALAVLLHGSAAEAALVGVATGLLSAGLFQYGKAREQEVPPHG